MQDDDRDTIRNAVRAIHAAAPSREGKHQFRTIIGVEGGGEQRRQRGVARWPIHSEAMGVAPSQAKELADYLATQGVPTEVDRSGCPVLTSPRHRKAVAEARGFFDRNGGYSDPQRR